MPQIGDIKKGAEIGYQGSGKRIWQACSRCGKERWVTVRVKKGVPVSLRCLSCANSRRNGRRNTSQGYILIHLKPDDFFYSMTDKDVYVAEHRLVVARALGRCLHSWEIVHHKGTKYPKGSKEDKADNRYPENLQLVTDDRHRQITILENKIKHLEIKIQEQGREINQLRNSKPPELFPQAA